MNMMRKGQVRGVAKGDVREQVIMIARLFGVAGEAEQSESLPPSFYLPSISCNTTRLAVLRLSHVEIGRCILL